MALCLKSNRSNWSYRSYCLPVQFSDAGPRSRQNPTSNLLNSRISDTQATALDLHMDRTFLCPQNGENARLIQQTPAHKALKLEFRGH